MRPLPRRAGQRPLRALSHPRQGLDDPPHGPAERGRAAAGGDRADARRARASACRPTTTPGGTRSAGPACGRSRSATPATSSCRTPRGDDLRPRVPGAVRDRARARGRAGRARRGARRVRRAGRALALERLERRLGARSDSEIRRRARETPATLIAFDLLHAGRESLLELPVRGAPRAARGAGARRRRAGRRPPTTAATARPSRGGAERGRRGDVAKRLDERLPAGRDSAATGAGSPVPRRRRGSSRGRSGRPPSASPTTSPR